MSKSERASDREPWECMESETARQYEKFCAYRDMHYKPEKDANQAQEAIPQIDLTSDRSIRRLANQLGIKRQALERLSVKFRWRDRCEAYDTYILQKMRVKSEAEILKMREKHALIASLMLKKAKDRLLTMPDEEIGASDLIRFIDVGVKIERLSRGESTEKQEIDGEATVQHKHSGAVEVKQKNELDLSSLSDEELGSLEQLLCKLHPEPGV